MVLGSNANPISPVDGTTLPRVWPDDAVMLIQPLPPRSLENLTLTAVVTRQGQLTSLRALHEGPPDADLAQAISRLASGVALCAGARRGRTGRHERRLAPRADDRARRNVTSEGGTLVVRHGDTRCR